MSSAKTARWLDLVAFLLHRRYPVTREDIFQDVSAYGAASLAGERKGVRAESARRTFERDKDELRALGIIIETVAIASAEGDEPAQGYRLKQRDFYLPYFELTDRPIAAAAAPYQGLQRIHLSAAELEVLDRATKRVAERSESALAGAASSLRRKLAFDLPISGQARETVIADEVAPATRSALATLQEAVAHRTPVRCLYYAIGRDSQEEREIEPYGLFFSLGRWYAVGRARDRNALRVFRLDRLSHVSPLKGQPPFTVPADFSIRKWVGRAPWELAEREPETVRVRFAFPESRWVLHQQVGRAIDPEKDDGGAVLEFDVRDLGPLLRWLLSFGSQAHVLSPPAVAQELADLRSRVAAVYEEAGT